MAEQSFPEVHVTGPVHHYVRALNSYNPGIWYLGTAEVTPQIRKRKYKKDVKNTIASGSLPFQRTYEGQAATIAVLLTYWSKFAVGTIEEADAALGNTPLAGSESRWSRGHLVFGQSTFELWQVFENFLNPNAELVTPGLEIGWYWPQVELLDSDTVAAGTQEEQQMLVLDATPYWIRQASYTAVNANLNERGYRLYSNDPADFPADVRIPQ